MRESTDSKQVWVINGNYDNITLDTPIRCYWTSERNGVFYDMKQYEQGTLRSILTVFGAQYVGNDK